jgi:hypothetical protein
MAVCREAARADGVSLARLPIAAAFGCFRCRKPDEKSDPA